MAGAQFSGGKHKGAGEVKAMFRHNKKDSRMQSNYTNQDINKNRTYYNSSYYGLSYKAVCEKYDRRISELDRTTNRNKRKDRVTMQSIVVTAPKGMPDALCHEWFREVGKLVIEQYGESNLLDMDFHFDEVHEYFDAEKKEYTESRPHGHICLVPEVDGQLNGKVFSARQNIMALNNCIQQMTIKNYGLSFMDGSKKKSKASVEELKQRSCNEEFQNSLKTSYKRQEVVLKQQMKNYMKKSRELEKRQSEVLERENDVNALEMRLKAQEAVLRQQMINLQVREKNVLERESALSEREKKNDVLIRLGRKAASMGISTVDVQTESTQRRFSDIGMGY